MPGLVQRRARIATARASFLSYGDAPSGSVTDIIAASWRRSSTAGVNATTSQPQFHDDLDVAGRLVRCSEPVIARLSDEIARIPLSIVLTDHRARILSRSETDRAIGALLDEVSLAPGFNYAETSVGTNGIGTVFESGQPLFIVGAEHFHEQLQPFACAGSPIRDPLTGRVEGVLDISCLSEDSSPLMHSLVRSAAHEIERNLLVDRSQCQQALFDTFVRLDARSRGAVMAISGAVVMQNSIAQNLFDPEEQWLIHEHARYLMGAPGDPIDTVPLPSGRTVQIRGTRITVGKDVAGIVIGVDVIAEAAMPVAHQTLLVDRSVTVHSTFDPLPQHPPVEEVTALPNGPGSLLWKRAHSTITHALQHEQLILIIGEPGCGKSALLADAYLRTVPDGTVRVIEPDDESLGALAHIGLPDRDGKSLIVLSHIEQLSSTGIVAVTAFLHRYLPRAGASVAATAHSGRLPDDAAFSALLSNFDNSVVLAPLRHRAEDIPMLVTRLLENLTGRRYTAVSSAALRLIRRFSWPRNISQLEEALKFALSRRPVGEIQAEDLPGFCHSGAGYQLSAVEASERDLIVRALLDAHGNRLHAAAALGIARSSLYRKLKSFGIIAA
ncbi:MAG: GAF domain-containing protein [Candidatus Saccharibacteria bacterium]|nr:GAF domain-containing protein [Microbacteriaceae bacterium]